MFHFVRNSCLLASSRLGVQLSRRKLVWSSGVGTSPVIACPLRMFTNHTDLISRFAHSSGFTIMQQRRLSSRKPESFKPPSASIPNLQEKNKSGLMLVVAIVVMVLGGSYAAVPLYRIYCQKTGKGGQAFREDDINERVAKLKPVKSRKIKVNFEADKSSRLAWDFKPTQPSVTVAPGETVLAFYTARNHLDRPVNGIATYNILPYEAGQYFNKIQCFCFEEQQLNANEEVDLPVFFFIDPEYTSDPALFDVDNIVLCYNFFETKAGFKLPPPPPVRAHRPPELKMNLAST